MWVPSAAGLASRTNFNYDYPTYDRPDSLYPPQFRSVSGRHTVRQDNTTVLPCAVKDLGKPEDIGKPAPGPQ